MNGMGVFLMKLNKMREQMANAFIDSLKEDKIPWHKEWSTVASRPYNVTSDTKYKGNNAFWLAWTAQVNGYDDPRWCTFKQAQEKGWKIKKGEKGTPIEFWSLYDIEEKKKINQAESKKLMDELGLDFFKRVKPISSTYYVFNAVQLEGVPELDITTYQLNAEELISCRDKLISNMEVDFAEGGDKASYSPEIDRIAMPHIERFESEYAYMSTFLHEAAHASGASHRLNRNIANTFGTPEYAKEELRAEIASAFTAQVTGIQFQHNNSMENHKAYIQSWIETLENNPNELFSAINDAEKISDYLIEKGEFSSVLVQELQTEKVSITKQEQAINKVEMLKQEFVRETGEDLIDWKLGQITAEQMKEMLSHGNTQELELAINELGEAGLGRTEKLRIETLDSVREFSNLRTVVKNAEKSIDYFPDQKVSVDDMYNYGYTYSGMLPLSKEKAIELLQDDRFEIFRLYPDNTEASMDGKSVENDNDEVMYGIEKESWERHLYKQNEVNMVQDIATAEKLLNLQEEECITVWFGDYNMYEAKIDITSEQIKAKYEEYSKMIDSYKKIEGIKISDIAIDEDNYIHFTAQTGDYEFDGLYRVYDPQNGADNKLVSIENRRNRKIFAEQWDNIENFLKEYASPIYADIEKYQIPVCTLADAATIRLITKGRKNEKFSEEHEWVKVAKQVKKRLDEGKVIIPDETKVIKYVLANEVSNIDRVCGINDVKYTKNIIASTYSRNNELYKEYMNVTGIEDRDMLIPVSEKLGARLFDENINLYSDKGTEILPVQTRKDIYDNSEIIYVNKNDWEKVSKEKKDILPVIKCEWSEHVALDGGKRYLISEFDSILKNEDKEWVKKRNQVIEKYGDSDTAFEEGTPEESYYMGYAKTKFEIEMKDGNKLEERFDIGDGFGGLIDMLEKYDSVKYKNATSQLKEAIDKENIFIEYQDKIKAVQAFTMNVNYSETVLEKGENSVVRECMNNYSLLDAINKSGPNEGLSPTQQFMRSNRSGLAKSGKNFMER